MNGGFIVVTLHVPRDHRNSQICPQRDEASALRWVDRNTRLRGRPEGASRSLTKGPG